MELVEKTLIGISNSMNSILKAEKEQNEELLVLLHKSTGFNGVENFDTDHVQSLESIEHANSWSLPIITLTCIATALPKICKHTVNNLLRSVDKGLSYSHLVEETLNHEEEYVKLRKSTVIIWNEVKHKRKWLGIGLRKYAFRGKTTIEILKWYSDRSKEIMRELNTCISKENTENTFKELIAANSVYRIAETIKLQLESNTEHISEEQLFNLLNSLTADILSACFTNIPQVITFKCHESVREKRAKC